MPAIFQNILCILWLFIFWPKLLEAVLPNTRFQQGLASIPIAEEEVLIGQSATLPCDFGAKTTTNHSAILALLFFNNERNPFSSIDFRTGNSSPRIFTLSDKFSGRIRYEKRSGIPSIFLGYAEAADEGVFKCRIDFRSSPTRVKKLRIKMIDPIHKLLVRVKEQNGSASDARTIIGPYRVGTKLVLTCKALGGNRVANISWWHFDKLLPNQEQFSSVNVLTLPPLTRGDQYKMITCKAHSSSIAPVIKSTLTIDVIMPPRRVRITTDKSYLQPDRGPKIVTVQENEELTLECQVLLSEKDQKDLKIVWNKSSQRSSSPNLKSTRFFDEKTPDFGQKWNQSSGIVLKPESQSSLLVLKPTHLDNGSLIRCKALSSIYPKQGTEDAVKLNVLFGPRVSLVPRKSDVGNIQQGEDLYLECQVSANPPVSSIKWYKNNQLINSTSKMLITSSSSSLIVRQVTSETSGIYWCYARNSVSSAHSNKLDIKVPSIPECKVPTQTIESDLGLNVTLFCNITAHPSVLNYRWEVDDRSNGSEWKRFLRQTTNNRFNYSVRNRSDFRTVYCHASNAMGDMANPCALIIVSTGKPEPVENCQIFRNNTQRSQIFLKCDVGFSKFSQRFNIEVYNIFHPQSLPMFNFTTERLTIDITHMVLDRNKIYGFNITSINSKGKSLPVSLFYPDQRNMGTSRSLTHLLNSTQITAIALGVLLTLAVSLLVVVCSLKWNYRRKKHKNKDFYSSSENEEDCFIASRSSRTSSVMDDSSFRYADYSRQSAGRLVIGASPKKRKMDITNYEARYGFLSNNPQVASTGRRSPKDLNCAAKNKELPVRNEEAKRLREEYKSNRFHARRSSSSVGQERNSNSLKSFDSWTSDGGKTISLQTVLINPDFQTDYSQPVVV